MKQKNIFEIKRTTDYVKCVTRSYEPNPVADIEDDDLGPLGYFVEDEIPMYINKPMEAKLEKTGEEYKVFARPQDTRMPWEEIGILPDSPSLALALARRISDCVSFAGGSVLYIHKGSERCTVRKKFIPFNFKYEIVSKL